MSKTTKSPRKVLLVAYATAKRSIPTYSHRYSPKKFTQHQLFACLVLKTFLRTDYRGIVAILQDCPELCSTINLSHTPHFTTLQKAANKLLCTDIANKLLDSTVQTVNNKRNKVKLAAIDSTGLESRHISPYFLKRRDNMPSIGQMTRYTKWPKLTVVCDCKNHLVISAIPTRGPRADVNQFRHILSQVVRKVQIGKILPALQVTTGIPVEVFRPGVSTASAKPTGKMVSGRWR